MPWRLLIVNSHPRNHVYRVQTSQCVVDETYLRSTKSSTGKVPMVDKALSTCCRTKENALPVFQLHEKNRPSQDQGDQVGKNYGE